MKKVFSTVCILLLSNLAKAADIGLNDNSFGEFTRQGGVIAMNGTSTCLVAGKDTLKVNQAFEKLTLKELRDKLQKTSSIQQKQELLDLIEKTLIDENFSQK